jgi:hypothetical protein
LGIIFGWFSFVNFSKALLIFLMVAASSVTSAVSSMAEKSGNLISGRSSFLSISMVLPPDSIRKPSLSSSLLLSTAGTGLRCFVFSVSLVLGLLRGVARLFKNIG